MNTELIKSTWLIVAKTNLHVGDECSTGYGLIDKSIQRDALMQLPCINSSSLKGALNEYCTHSAKLDAKLRIEIFGVDKGKTDTTTKKGNTYFFEANILFLPVRDDKNLYHYVTSEKVLKRFKEQSKLFSNEIVIPETRENNKPFCSIKGFKAEVLKHEEFDQLCSNDELPIIARNVLENGESQNLWYEQVIPPETIFYTFLQYPGIKTENKADVKTSAPNTIEKAITDKIIQIGANATIGYGYCKFLKI